MKVYPCPARLRKLKVSGQTSVNQMASDQSSSKLLGECDRFLPNDNRFNVSGQISASFLSNFTVSDRISTNCGFALKLRCPKQISAKCGGFRRISENSGVLQLWDFRRQILQLSRAMSALPHTRLALCVPMIETALFGFVWLAVGFK